MKQPRRLTCKVCVWTPKGSATLRWGKLYLDNCLSWAGPIDASGHPLSVLLREALPQRLHGLIGSDEPGAEAVLCDALSVQDRQVHPVPASAPLTPS